MGKDPLQIDTLYTVNRYTDGSAHAQQRAMSGIEMALWDLAGKLLEVPVYKLLGGKFRNRVRLYDHATPSDFFDRAALRDWAQRVKESPFGINMHKFGPLRNSPSADFGRDPANRMLSSDELRRLRQGFENCREALGFEHDILIGCHWEFDLRSAIDLAAALESVKPRFLEDPLPVAYSESWKRLAEMSPVPICTGENWMRRADALPFVTNAAIDILHPDLRNSGGFLENKRMADLADLYFLPMANHNTGSIVNGMATIHWASTIRDYFACETVFFDGDWMDDVIVHDGPLAQEGFVKVPDKPGLGIELDADVVKAHLVPGETWWGLTGVAARFPACGQHPGWRLACAKLRPRVRERGTWISSRFFGDRLAFLFGPRLDVQDCCLSVRCASEAAGVCGRSPERGPARLGVSFDTPQPLLCSVALQAHIWRPLVFLGA